MASLLSLIYLKPILLINTKDSLCAALEHSYQLLNCFGNSIGGKHGANAILSRSQTINILVNEKAKKLNGKAKQQT